MGIRGRLEPSEATRLEEITWAEIAFPRPIGLQEVHALMNHLAVTLSNARVHYNVEAHRMIDGADRDAMGRPRSSLEGLKVNGSVHADLKPLPNEPRRRDMVTFRCMHGVTPCYDRVDHLTCDTIPGYTKDDHRIVQVELIGAVLAGIGDYFSQHPTEPAQKKGEDLE